MMEEKFVSQNLENMEAPEMNKGLISAIGKSALKSEQVKQPSGVDSLYNIAKTDDGFTATLPGLYSKELEGIVGTTQKHYSTIEEAQQATEESKRKTGELLERISLEKTFTDSFFRIDETDDKTFKVTLPGLVDSKTGYYVGTTSFDFNTWQEAKGFYLNKLERDERLTTKPLLEIQVSEREKIAFSDIDAFHPRVAPSNTSHEIPESIQKYLFDKNKNAGTDPSASTYQETIKEKYWDKEIFSFASSYLKESGAEIFEKLHIKRLDSLTPKQAIELSTQLVIDLTKYNISDTAQQNTQQGARSKADQSTTLQLLQDGKLNRDNPNWEGNGVCRNFASMVKAVFESFKANQTQFSRLRDTYCLYESGDSFAPKRKSQKNMSFGESGHAWNTFVTISQEGSANAVVVDATWAKRDLDTKEVKGLDYTLARMEPMVFAIGEGLSEDAPHKEEQLNHIMLYYALKIEKPGGTGGYATADEEKASYATQALKILYKQGLPNELPSTLIKAFGEEFTKLDEIDTSEIEILYQIAQQSSDLPFNDILENYLGDFSIGNHYANKLIFRNSDELQKIIFERVQSLPGGDTLIENSPAFRVRMREVAPEILGDFSPSTQPADAAELKHLISSISELSNDFNYYIDTRNLSEEKINKIFERIRQKLRQVNPQKYDETLSTTNDYQLIKEYRKIYSDLRT